MPGAASAIRLTLDELATELAKGISSASAAALLAEAGRQLLTAPRAEAVAAVIGLLDRRSDAATGLNFEIGPGGDLTGASTLRVWLLDQLGRLDAIAAARYALRIYERRDSADEWAVALRNDWRDAVQSGRIEPVRARALELIGSDEWAARPSVGFLEALDLTVATLAVEAVPRFEQWLSPAHPTALRVGAWIALDRMTMEMPEDFLPMLAGRADWLKTQPMLRAGLVARADLNVARERQAVEDYLNRADVSAEEAARFFELIPNVSAAISPNLATTARIPSAQRAAELDRKTLAAIREWQSQPGFARWAGGMASAEERLAQSVASAVRGGYLNP